MDIQVTNPITEENKENEDESVNSDSSEGNAQSGSVYESKGVSTLDKETEYELRKAQSPLPIIDARPLPIIVARNIPESAFEFDIARPCEIRITGIAVLELDRIILCNNKGTMLFVYSTSGKYIQEVSLLSNPFDIAVLGDRKAALVSFKGEKYIQFVNIARTHVSPGYKLIIKGPCTGGISVYNDNVAIGINKGIEIYNLDGWFVKLIESSMDNICYLKYANENISYSNGIVYVKKEVKNGQKTLNIRYGEFEQMSPLGIALVPNGDIYIADYRNDKVLTMNSGSKHVRTEVSDKDILYGPRALCLSLDFSKLFIVNNDGQSVYIHCLKNSSFVY